MNLKRNLFTACAIAVAGMVSAQTNFRDITFDQAIEAAQKENKLVFVDFYTDWCGPCKMMARDVFPQKELGDYMNGKFVSVKLNAEKEGKELARSYKVAGYPTFLVVDTNKEIKFRKLGGADASAFMAELERNINPNMSPEQMEKRYKDGERSLALVKGYAAYLMSQSRGGGDTLEQEALKIVTDYFNSLNDAQRISNENMFIYMDFTQRMVDVPGQYLVANFSKFPKESQAVLLKKVDELFKELVYAYLYGERPVAAKDYALMKEQVNKMGVNKDKWFNPMFELIECREKKDYNALLDLCEKLYPTMNESQRVVIIGGMNSIIATDDKVIRKRAAQFIRQRLPEMTLGQLMNVVYPLSMLERE